MINIEKNFNKSVLIAVDESENARRAVSYVAQILAGIKGFKVLILHVIRQPEEDYFPTSSEKDRWLGQYKLKVDAMLKDYRQILMRAGFAPEDVSVRSTLRYCLSWRSAFWQSGTNPDIVPLWLVDRDFHEARSSFLAVSPVRLLTMHATARSGWWSRYITLSLNLNICLFHLPLSLKIQRNRFRNVLM